MGVNANVKVKGSGIERTYLYSRPNFLREFSSFMISIVSVLGMMFKCETVRSEQCGSMVTSDRSPVVTHERHTWAMSSVDILEASSRCVNIWHAIAISTNIRPNLVGKIRPPRSGLNKFADVTRPAHGVPAHVVVVFRNCTHG